MPVCDLQTGRIWAQWICDEDRPPRCFIYNLFCRFATKPSAALKQRGPPASFWSCFHTLPDTHPAFGALCGPGCSGGHLKGRFQPSCHKQLKSQNQSTRAPSNNTATLRPSPAEAAQENLTPTHTPLNSTQVHWWLEQDDWPGCFLSEAINRQL